MGQFGPLDASFCRVLELCEKRGAEEWFSTNSDCERATNLREAERLPSLFAPDTGTHDQKIISTVIRGTDARRWADLRWQWKQSLPRDRKTPRPFVRNTGCASRWTACVALDSGLGRDPQTWGSTRRILLGERARWRSSGERLPQHDVRRMPTADVHRPSAEQTAVRRVPTNQD